ncbi:hypothetical protein ACEQPO_26370 [Bacillus sp. SL00103]
MFDPAEMKERIYLPVYWPPRRMGSRIGIKGTITGGAWMKKLLVTGEADLLDHIR